MFKPNYSITPDILNNLIKTAEAKALLDNAYLVPKWEVALRREALIKNAHASTAIEGNSLSFEQVSELAMGRDIMAARKAKTEVLNYLRWKWTNSKDIGEPHPLFERAEGVMLDTSLHELSIRLAIVKRREGISPALRFHR